MSLPYCILLCSCPDQDSAETIAKCLVQLKLAACVNILPKMRSIYSWKGTIEQADEYLLLIKTRSERYKAIEDTITTLHPYELPEVISVSLQNGLTEYLQWIDHSLE
ncbi:MAG: divalent-cation tolerance protein CutA [Gammaproteobacteria bacterium]|nr:divalent-cation tolerance protein CutA [Gammaproteobacteria bacterium]